MIEQHTEEERLSGCGLTRATLFRGCAALGRILVDSKRNRPGLRPMSMRAAMSFANLRADIAAESGLRVRPYEALDQAITGRGQQEKRWTFLLDPRDLATPNMFS